MESSIVIAQLIAVVMGFVTLSLFINPRQYQEIIKDLWKSPVLLYFMWLTSLVIGAAIVFAHNIWVANWTVIITLIGWISGVKWVIMLLFPTWFVAQKKNWTQQNLLYIYGLASAIITIVLIRGIYGG
jgi:hypothetical protein